MYIYIYMASVNISLKKEAYERLITLKRPEESFSDEVLRLTENKTGANLLACISMLKGISNESENEFEEGVKKAKISSRSILKKTKGIGEN